MIIKTKQIKGKGRGKGLGFPTVNMVIPDDMPVPEGIYAGWFIVDGETFKAAIHYGPVPAYDEHDPTLEAHIVDMEVEDFFDQIIELDIVERLRDIEEFEDEDGLLNQIERDINKTRAVLK